MKGISMLLALGAVGVVSGGGTVPVVPAGEHCSSSGIRTVDPKQEKPLLRVGLISDTHITQKKESCRLVQAAMELFREHQADLIINLGDIAEKYTEAGYRHYRQTVSEVFAGAEKVPQEIFVYANHDYINGKGSSLQEIATNIKKSLEIPNDPACRMTINSCVFVVLPQFYDLKSYENDIASAVKENPGKPIFVLDHIPPCNTFFNTRVWGSRKVGKILEKYPSVVHLSGHVHGTAANELSIWQGKYTAVNAGSLSPWFGCFAGLDPAGWQGNMALTMDVFTDKLVFRRFYVEDKTGLPPWIVPLPFDPASAPYTPARRRAASSAPQFPAGAAVKVQEKKEQMIFAFPAAQPTNDLFFIRCEVEQKKGDAWQRTAAVEFPGEFYLPQDRRSSELHCKLDKGYFDARATCRIKLFPVNFWGKEGTPLVSEAFTVSGSAAEKVFESFDPMKECPFLHGLSDSDPVELGADGFYRVPDRANVRLVFPDKVWQGKAGSRFRLVIDMQTRQNGGDAWTMLLRNPVPLENAHSRIATFTGNPGVLRYVINFKKENEAFNYYLLLRESQAGTIRFNYVRIEKVK